MSWLKFDDRFLDHPKFVRLEDKAPSRGVHLFLGLVSYCKQHVTDGRVPRDMIRKVNGPHQRWRMQALEALVDVELVEADGDELVIHDFLDWNPSREEIASGTRKDLKPPKRPGPRPESKVIDGRQRGDEDLTTRRQRGDEDLTASRQHIKGSDSNDSRAENLARPRSRSESESESESDLKSPSIPQTPAPQLTLVPNGSTSEPRRRKSPKAPKARNQPCPADLKPDPTTASEAWELGFTDALRDFELKKHIDWALSKSVLRSNWQASLRNWLRKSAEDRGLKPRKPHDAESLRWQEQRRAATESPINPVKLPADFEAKLGAVIA